MVLEVHSVDVEHAMLSELIESQPDFRPIPHRARLDGRPLGAAIRGKQACGTAPGSATVPLMVAGRVRAVIELTDIDLSVEPQALTGLLELACETLSERAGALAALEKAPVFVNPEASPRFSPHPSVHDLPSSGMLESPDAPGRPQSSFVPGLRGDKQQVQESGIDDHDCQPFRQGSMLAPLNKHSRPFAPAESRESVGPVVAAPGPLLDPAALARLTELDPKGENQLLERVLRAFQSSAARLRPQADAARLSGDPAAVRLVAHTLKSSSASIGAMHLSQLCAQVETTIRTGAHDDLGAQLDALNTALDSALNAIGQLLEARA
jgi:HPt (histidine-containing phosphotransfer) domain-containing protein